MLISIISGHKDKSFDILWSVTILTIDQMKHNDPFFNRTIFSLQEKNQYEKLRKKHSFTIHYI